MLVKVHTVFNFYNLILKFLNVFDNLLSYSKKFDILRRNQSLNTLRQTKFKICSESFLNIIRNNSFKIYQNRSSRNPDTRTVKTNTCTLFFCNLTSV